MEIGRGLRTSAFILSVALLTGCAASVTGTGRPELGHAPPAAATATTPNRPTARATTPAAAPTTTTDPQQIIREYDAAVGIACQSATQAPLTQNNAAAVADTATYYRAAWSSHRSSQQFLADVSACSGPARQQRLAAECDHDPQVELLNRNPDAAAGECARVVFSIVQFDQGTGPCSFRANFDTTQHEYNFEYRGENAIVVFSEPCRQLDAVGVDDVLRMRVQIVGGLTYDTTSGGTATAVQFTSVGEEGVEVLQNN